VAQFTAFASRLDVADVKFIPISALHGDNVVEKSERMRWYAGAPLLYTLETAYIASDANHLDARFPVQSVIRPQNTAHHDFRGFAGRVASGVFKPGDEIVALPSGFTSRIKSIYAYDREVEEAYWPMSVVITLDDEIDISRGGMLAKPNNMPQTLQDIDLMLCWFSERPLQPNGKYILRHTTRETRCLIKEIRYKVNINTLHKLEDDNEVRLNDIARVQIRTTQPLFCDPYRRNRNTGSAILIEESTNNTVAAITLL
jgi:sulfate adenylyltransferase subunit 1